MEPAENRDKVTDSLKDRLLDIRLPSCTLCEGTILFRLVQYCHAVIVRLFECFLH
jgi:hypothetical protein